MIDLKTILISALIGALLGIIVIPYFKSLIKKKFWGPKTLVCLFGTEQTYPLCKSNGRAKITRAKITIHPVKAPYDITNLDVPDLIEKWEHSPEHKLYRISAQNQGKGVDDIKIDIDFNGGYIENIEIINPVRVELIQGGKVSGSRAVFRIKELLPNEGQDIKILVKGKKVESFAAWSKITGDKDTFIYDIVYSPPEPYFKQ